MNYKRACLISENSSAIRWDITTKTPMNPNPDKTNITVKQDDKYKAGYTVVQRDKIDGKHYGNKVRTSRRFQQPDKFEDWKPSKHSRSLGLIMQITEKLFGEIEDRQLLEDEELKERIPEIIQYLYNKQLDTILED